MQYTPFILISFMLTIVYVIGAVNAFNIVDGMDGLCASLFLISGMGFFVIGVRESNMFLVILAGILSMNVLGFLPYNLHPARIFLGDGGSGFLGFMCAVMAIVAISPSSSGTHFLSSLMIVGIPVLDMAAAILRRAFRKKALFIGDRDHLYDVLLKKRMTQSQVWGIMCILHLMVVVAGIVIR
jgi:UDP-GlcNAc:undecaprenyl-phosphate GlcNAc-1-phosphate transferase